MRHSDRWKIHSPAACSVHGYAGESRERNQPQLVSKITDQNGNVVTKFGVEVLNEVDYPSVLADH